MVKVVMALVSTAVGLVLVLSFKSHSVGAPKSALAGVTPGPGASDGAPAGARAGKKRKGHKKASSRSGTYVGSPIATPYGTMQVAAVIADGRLTNVKVLRQTDVGGRSGRIDAEALPILKSEALKAHSANIDAVSGATYTSRGYARSLQSALDKAGV